jgi:hypothetical protein
MTLTESITKWRASAASECSYDQLLLTERFDLLGVEWPEPSGAVSYL